MNTKEQILLAVNCIPAIVIIVGVLFGIDTIGFNMALILVISVVNVFLCKDKNAIYKNGWSMMITIAVAQGVATGMYYLTKDSTYKTPMVGVFFIVIQSGMALAFMLIGALIVSARDYMKSKHKEL